MTRNNNIGLRLDDWNEHNVKALARTHWRASLVPAAAVIPAPVAYIKVVAVKKLVVGRLSNSSYQFFGDLPNSSMWCSLIDGEMWALYLEETRVFKAGFCPNTAAGNNHAGMSWRDTSISLIGTVGGIRTQQSEVKFLDLLKTD